MTIISAPRKDPEVRPEQRTATIVYFEKMRLTAQRTIGVLALAPKSTRGWEPTLLWNQLHSSAQRKPTMSEMGMFRQLTNRLSLKYQRADVERAKPFCLVCREFRRLDSRKTPTLFA
jgi:hypothetical protein